MQAMNQPVLVLLLETLMKTLTLNTAWQRSSGPPCQYDLRHLPLINQ